MRLKTSTDHIETPYHLLSWLCKRMLVSFTGLCPGDRLVYNSCSSNIVCNLKTPFFSSTLPNRRKKKQLSHEVSIYNPAGTNFLPGQNGLPKTREDDESHVYDTIEDTLVYTHLLKKGAEIGIYGQTDTYQFFAGHADSQKPLVSKDSSVNDKEAHQPYRFSSQGPPLPNRPPSHNQPMVSNDICQTENQSEEDRSSNLGLRLEPEGGN